MLFCYHNGIRTLIVNNPYVLLKIEWQVNENTTRNTCEMDQC